MPSLEFQSILNRPQPTNIPIKKDAAPHLAPPKLSVLSSQAYCIHRTENCPTEFFLWRIGREIFRQRDQKGVFSNLLRELRLGDREKIFRLVFFSSINDILDIITVINTM